MIYIGLGWGKNILVVSYSNILQKKFAALPTLVVGPWIHMRVKTEDTFCWTKSDNLVPKLIIKIPTMISILVN